MQIKITMTIINKMDPIYSNKNGSNRCRFSQAHASMLQYWEIKG